MPTPNHEPWVTLMLMLFIDNNIVLNVVKFDGKW